MMTFLLSAGAMIIVLLLIICIPLLTFRKKDTGAEELPQANIAIYRDQFKELEDELARGAISQNEYDESRLELERRVIEESIPESRSNRPIKKPAFTRFLSWFWLFLSLPWLCGLLHSISVTSA